MLHDRISPAPILCPGAAVALFAPFLTGLASERLCVAYLDARFGLLDVTVGPPGQEGSVCVSLRSIVRDALRVNAEALILAHNHPHGGRTPSEADRRVTRRVSEVLRELNIRLVDHLLFAGGEVTSFRELSLL